MTSSDALRGISPGIKALGLCMGASTVSVVQMTLDGDFSKNGKPRVVDISLRTHEGDPKETLRKVLGEIDLKSFDRIAATGRRFRHFINLTSIPEPEAVEYAYRHVKPDGVDCPAVVSAGGETFMVYVLNRSGQISNVLTGNKCASGTGEFLLQQLRRMDVSLDEAAEWAATETPYQVSGRCSVFCKSDCTHATNKGVPRSKVTAGLCKMMSSKILELLKKVDRRNIMVTGGTTGNRMMVEYLSQEIPGLIVPEEAPYFEALGAALWAFEHETAPVESLDSLFLPEAHSFDTLPPLKDFSDIVEFKTMETGTVRAGDRCIIGLDVGSTTTKAVLMRTDDQAVLTSIYLRTNGDPVGASRQCYRAIRDQIAQHISPEEIEIFGLGVCGSGRQIAGLHALTDGVINEIIAHAAAAVYFDPQVDTIFEIGGQDAKYTYITNSVPSDYAMNEACSAGTGSFLEESALETLGVRMEEIGDIAMTGKVPPNFNDQCAAFISSDIKNAIHEGVRREDIVAGLVYSICMNYTNRVKGNRPVGEKVFMQGGVCYNPAVPLAMAALVGKPIIVPPEPGLMGAFGVALELQRRIDSGLMAASRFSLDTLIDRDVRHGKSFTCKGGKGKCDRRCDIAMIEIEGKNYPFGGACNRYYNMRRNVSYDLKHLDLVRVRQELIFEKYAGPAANAAARPGRKRIGFNRSFLINTYYPLYYTFFTELGLDVVMADTPSPEGIDLRNAAFCYPAELAHGFFYSLLKEDIPPDYLFLPHFKTVPVPNGLQSAQLCPLIQGEPFFLQATYRKQIEKLGEQGLKVISPLLDLIKGIESARKPLIDAVTKIGIRKNAAEKAFRTAAEQQSQCMAELGRIGQEAIADIEKDPDRTAVVIFGRPYNAFAGEAHMGIPHKLASRGVTVIPFDMLPLEPERSKRHMFWGMGQLLLKGARFVERHPQLFGTYITNFSCGPDSFILGYFRDIMGRKPSLTLELDSHTADAGLETRIEAFLDIISSYRQLRDAGEIELDDTDFVPARTFLDGDTPMVVTSSGETLPMAHPRVTVLFPSMGRISTDMLATVFRARGFTAYPHPPADEAILKIGRAHTSCKECLPLILTTGTLLNYIHNIKHDGEILIYFMATGAGPCRFGQYFIFMEDMIRRQRIEDIAMFSLTAENSYAGLGNDFQMHAWWALVIADVLEDIRSMLLANAAHPAIAMETFERELQRINRQFESLDFASIEHQLERTALEFQRLGLKKPVHEVPLINLTGEIFVRRDSLSRQFLTEQLAEKGFATICTPIAEWIHYSDYLYDKNLTDDRMSKFERIAFLAKRQFVVKYERRIKKALNKSGLVHAEPLDVASIIENAKPYISRNLTGEAVLTVGGALTEIVSEVCGVIAIGPFGCMPNRLSESILNEVMNRNDKIRTDPKNDTLRKILEDVDDLPFLSIESDGSPFPQIITAQIEAFCLRAERLHQKMIENGSAKKRKRRFMAAVL